MKRLSCILATLVILVGMLVFPASATGEVWKRYNNYVMPIDYLAGNTGTDSLYPYQCICSGAGKFAYYYSKTPILSYQGYAAYETANPPRVYIWYSGVPEWYYDEAVQNSYDNRDTTYQYTASSGFSVVWSNHDIVDYETGQVTLKASEPEIVLSDSVDSSSSSSGSSGSSGTTSGMTSDGAEIKYSETGEHAVALCPPSTYSYEMNDTPAPLALRVDGPDDAIVTYQWYCAIVSDYTEVRILDCGTNAHVNPITVLPGLYRYFCLVKFAETVDGELVETYVVSPVYYVSVYAHDDSDLTDIKDSISEIELTQVAISGKLDEVIESIGNITVSFDEMQQTLDGIQTELTGTPEAEQEADEFNQTIDEKNDEFNEGMDILGGMTEPNYEDIDASFDDIFGDDSKGDGIDLATKAISALFDNDYIFQVFFIAFMLALVSFVVFGKR